MNIGNRFALTPWGECPQLVGALLLASLLWTANPVAAGAGQESVAIRVVALDLQGEMVGKGNNGIDNVSAIASDPDNGLMLVGMDEGDQIQVFRKKKDRDHLYETDERSCIALDPAADQDRHRCSGPAGTEVDIEGIAWGKRFVYVVGSHSRVRKRVKGFTRKGNPLTRKKNRMRLATVEIEPRREQLFRFSLDSQGRLAEGSLQATSLRNLIVNHPVLSPFQAIPGKENGIDIEGLGIDDEGRVYLGFRGPVLRGGYALVLRVEFDEDFKIDSKQTELLHVNLVGRGIRGMTEVDGNFLLLAGPTGGGSNSYQVWWWNGHDALPGKLSKGETRNGAIRGSLKFLCDIPQPGGSKTNDSESEAPAKAEGIVAVHDDRQSFIIVYDGAPRGAATRYHCPR